MNRATKIAVIIDFILMILIFANIGINKYDIYNQQKTLKEIVKLTNENNQAMIDFLKKSISVQNINNKNTDTLWNNQELYSKAIAKLIINSKDLASSTKEVLLNHQKAISMMNKKFMQLKFNTLLLKDKK